MTTPKNSFTVVAPDGQTIYVELGMGTDFYGITSQKPLRFLHVDGHHRGREKLDSVIHEATHVALPVLSESDVRTLAAFVTDVLWAAGYRRAGEGAKTPKKKD